MCTGHLYCVAAGTGVCNYFLHLTLLLACSQGWTPLLFASDKGHVEVARLLLEHKAAVNQANTKVMIHKIRINVYTYKHIHAHLGIA